ncbi:MAG: hypothetical protein CLLPBCKN_003302 [Chroococcidiopsis cubana SAG 39.79]|jgi:uncharacterized membrane protein|uniref:DUF2269 domain-containing protein n=1 Tax=Chroococcidiopsis cubana SAG 39.79 TaxID=388085 RepID=A0AB37UGP9_9CYAN|nr:hypothetical protein [Chroococcidiopsis cubana]MDZ4873906.1 hypothetical protein [Chroococcidiopsis cubana SAG 39.79]PSB63046.1 hypothetical protein C7B79_15520 [Chroococcidiopsis cubana CCALA 043]RUT10456.1 hypothetical protein DSM107010_42450 [Chroococcidiopsis cubana SAG 39.79]
MKKLSVKQKNWLLSVHVAVGSMWFGTALCMVAIALHNRNTINGDELYAINSVLKLLDDFVIIPAAVLSLITGGLLCWLTIWGFFKHYWVIVKWVMTVTLIVTGTIWLGPWTNAMTVIAQTERIQAWQNPLYVFDQKAVLIGAAIQTGCILAIVAISVIKPWGRRKIENRQQDRSVASS